MVIEGHLPKRL